MNICKAIVKFFLLGWLVLFYNFSFAHSIESSLAKKGLIDLRGIDLSKATVQLQGEWEFYKNQLLGPTDSIVNFQPVFVQVPELWNVERNGISAKGFGTYRLRIIFPVGTSSDQLALFVPDGYSAIRVFVNDEDFFQMGVPGTNAQSTVPLFRPAAKRLHFNGDTVTLLVQVANFHHKRGGLYRPFSIGNNDQLKNEREVNRSYDLFLTGCLFMGGLFFLGLFFFSRHDRVILYFSLFCLFYTYRIMGTDEYSLHQIFPKLSWFVALRLEYLSLFISVVFLTLYNRTLYPNEFHETVMQWFLLLAGSAILITLLLPSTIYTYLTDPFVVILILTLLYSFYVYIVAYIKKRPGAIYSLLSAMLLIALFALAVLSHYTNTHLHKLLMILLHVGFFFSQSLVLSYRFAYQLQSARDEALAAYRAKSTFLSTMSHEIRTPLNSVIGITQLMLQKKPEGEQKDLLDTLSFSANNLLYIINDILDISKIEAGKMSLSPLPTLLGKIGKQVVHSAKVLAKDKGIQLLFECDDRLFIQYVQIDPDRTTQVISNLVQNAIKFTHEGFVKVKMTITEDSTSKLLVKVEIIDTGIGISDSQQKLIFEKFTQADSTINRNYGGTGLGLSICKEILALQGVALQLESTLGKGSTFWFEHLLNKAESPAEAGTKGNFSELELQQIFSGKKVLLAEDNPINMMVAEKLFQQMAPDIEFLKAQNGEEAFHLYQQCLPHLVLMDINMPIMNGLDSTKAIRAYELAMGIAAVPILALSAGSIREDLDRCLNAGMNDMVAKPFKMEELKQVMAGYIEKYNE